MRTLVVHEWLVTWAGSERVMEQVMALFPDADLLVSVVAPSMRHYNAVTERARETWLRHLPGASRHHRWFLPLQALAFSGVDTRGYDLVVSSSHAFAKSVRATRPARHLCYCHSPPRYLWDMRELYGRSGSVLQRASFRLATPPLRRLDLRGARGVDRFVANSSYVAERIRRIYGRDAAVVYPPVTAKPAAPRPGGRGDYVLALGRLVPYKRVDLAIAAAERLGVRLVIAGGGPERARLERMAGPETEVIGEVSDAEAGALLEGCRAFIFCAEEDFGISPVEANAHGAPVVGYAAGGLLETMVPGVTAELFAEQTVEAVAEALERALSREWEDAAIRANAARFSAERFRRELAAVCDRELGEGDRRTGRKIAVSAGT